MSKDVLIFESRDTLRSKEELEFKERVHNEALAMLEKVRDLIKDKRIGGLAVVFVLDDGSYGRMIPTNVNNIAALIGAMSIAHAELSMAEVSRDCQDCHDGDIE